MANCPRCGTADFYPSFSGKGECLEFRCDLFSKEHFEKTFKMPAEHPTPGVNYRITAPETSEVEKIMPANGWAPVTYKVGPIWSYNGSVTLPPIVEPEQAVDGSVGGEEPQPPDSLLGVDYTTSAPSSGLIASIDSLIKLGLIAPPPGSVAGHNAGRVIDVAGLLEELGSLGLMYGSSLLVMGYSRAANELLTNGSATWSAVSTDLDVCFEITKGTVTVEYTVFGGVAALSLI